MERYVVIW